MTTSAPHTRLVDALSGEITATPSQFFHALSEADSFVAELADVRELQTRVQELQAEDDAKAELIGELKHERDDLAEKLRELDEAHQITLGALAAARRAADYHGKATGGVQ